MRDIHGLPVPMGQHHHTSRRTSSDHNAIQVICLGSGGGPSEDNVTGFLVRSTASKWAKGSLLAVDAGSHLAAITRILERDFPLVAAARPRRSNAIPVHVRSPTPPNGTASNNGAGTSGTGSEFDANSISTSSRSTSPGMEEEPPSTTLQEGPFAGLSFPYASARANAVHVVREHVATYLITHPHLDHLAGFAINTAAFHNTSRPKRLAALPFTVNAIKSHIFNDVIWPNLTDEDNGVGFVTFQRLTEGGNLALGDGHSRGFIEVCDGLEVKGFRISHGQCASAPRPDHQVRRGSNPNIGMMGDGGSFSLPQAQMTHASTWHNSHNHLTTMSATAPDGGRRASVFSQPSQPGTPTFYGQSGPQPDFMQTCVVDSTAFFIRAAETGMGREREILVFGDVEPDSISLCPRTRTVWAEAAPKIALGILRGLLIECSYNDDQPDAVLFGHLAPRHLIAELQVLAEMVAERKKELGEKAGRKRKRASVGGGSPGVTLGADDGSRWKGSRLHRASAPETHGGDDVMGNGDAGTGAATPKSHHAHSVQLPLDPDLDEKVNPSEPENGPPRIYEGPLKGVRVVVIHVKDTMTDGPPVGESILQELWAHETRLALQGKALGCSFEISFSGASFLF